MVRGERGRRRLEADRKRGDDGERRASLGEGGGAERRPQAQRKDWHGDVPEGKEPTEVRNQRVDA